MWDCYGCGGDDRNDVAERAYRKWRRVSENQEMEDRLESLILRVGEKVLLLLSLNLQEFTCVGKITGFYSHHFY
jgi:nuclear cap-binding protein subunit 1